MASLVSRNGVYYAEFFDSYRAPKSRRFSLRTRDRSTARTLLARVEQAYALGEWDPWVETLADLIDRSKRRTVTLADAVELYISAKAVTSSPYTVRNYRRVLGLFRDSLPRQQRVQGVRRTAVESFISVARLSPSTLRYRLTVLRAFFRWCAAEGIASSDPTERVTPPREVPALPRAVTSEELNLVCAHLLPCRAWMGPAFRFAFVTGLRSSELARLRWRHVDRERRLLDVEKQKSGKASTVPLAAAALSVLDAVGHRSGQDYVFAPSPPPQSRRTGSVVTMLGDEFRRARKAAGVKRRISPHGLRHAFGTQLAEAGKSAFVIQAAARHANIQTSARYVHLAQRELLADLDHVFR